jgi:DUF4097 and DUF4098 domain-containing protein YvlB
MPKRSYKFLSLGVLGAALLLAATANSVAEVRETFKETLAFPVEGRFSIENINGSITVETWDQGSVQIEAVKIADSPESMKDIEIEVQEVDGGVQVKTRLPRHSRRGESRAVEYHIMLPSLADTTVETVNGRVDIRGVRGRVNASTVNGSVEVEEIAGEAEISTTNGSIKARYIEAFEGQHSFSTTNGSVTLYLPPDAGGEIDAETVNGSISTDFPATINKVSKNELRGTFGSGGGSFEISTVNGSVKIRKTN